MKMKINPLLLPLRAGVTALALLLSLLCLGALQSARAQGLDNIERGRMHDMLSQLKDDIKKNYYDVSYHGMDVDARFKAADEKLKTATSLGQALGIIAQAMIDLEDSHTFFLPPPRPETVDYGWRMEMIGEKCYVTAVKPGSDAEAQGLKPGDEIRAIDGFRPTRKEYWKMEYYYYGLSPRPGLRLIVQSPGAEPRQIDVAARIKQGKRVANLMGGDGSDLWDMLRENEKASRLENTHRFINLGNIVVWKMPNFNLEAADVNSIMQDRIKGHTALILDLRGNPGGAEEALKQMVGYFYDHDIKIGDLKGRKEMKPMVAKTMGSKIFDGKLVVLVDSVSASSAEIFARVAQLEKRGVVIGDRSAGAVMRARHYSHQVGTDRIVLYGASVTDADLIMVDGQSLEHTGVTPDELKLPTGAEMAAHEDPVMAYAVKLAGGNVTPAKAGSFFPVEWMP
jgi:C-terminal processing protease CtpA/Prc